MRDLLWILCLFGVLGFGGTSNVVQRINYGVVFKETNKVVLACDHWLHTFEINLPEVIQLPILATCSKSNSSCAMMSHILTQLNSIRSGTAARLNLTVHSIEELVPETQIRQSRSRRSLLPFIGKFSKSLFGLATEDDVNVLASHMNKLNRMAVGMAKTLTQHENHLSSFIKSANYRMDNLMNGIKDNMQAIKYVQAELHTTSVNLEYSFEYMMSLLIEQIKSSENLNHELDELKFGVNNLVNNKLSPLIIPSEVMESTLQDIQNMLESKFHGFHLALKSVNEVYSSCKYLLARNGTKLYVTLKLPVTYFKDPLTLYKVISMPVPINSSSDHATQLLNLPDHFVMTSGQQYYASLGKEDLVSCNGKSVRYCSSNIALSPVTTVSCSLALFANDKSKVKQFCNFRFIQEVVKPKIIEISPNSLLLYRTPLLSLECVDEHKMIKGCDFCIFNVPCKCAVSTNEYYLAPRLSSCKKYVNNTSIVHPVNLALLQHFFDNSFVENIFADTTFASPVNVTTPTIKLYKHDMSKIMVADTKAHLSLTKMATLAKKDAFAFQTLAEPLQPT